MSQAKQIELAEMHSVISARFIEPGFDFWFTNHEHIRSPFPISIRSATRERTSEIFFEWIAGLKENELSGMKEDEFVEMFETILFNEALKLVDDEDQQLTISYPFLPRLGDIVNHGINGQGNVVKRTAITTKENKQLFELTVLSKTTGKSWDTKFELTA